MAAIKKYCGTFAVALPIVVVTLPMTLLVLDLNNFCGESRCTAEHIFRANHNAQRDTSNEIATNKNIIYSVISPNLTTCHDSYGGPGLLINCCLPKFSTDDEADAVDFKFADPSLSPLRIRRPLHLVDEEYIAKYTRALSIMKSLPFSDPRSFYRQANVHCTFCTGAYDQKHSKATINIHRQWLFFPFHRMYIYFHERILGSLIGDDSFALPFWSWDNPEAMSFPDIFLNEPFVDTERDSSHFRPRVVDLSYPGDVSIESSLEPQEQVDFNLALMYNQVVSAAKKPELFMGCPSYPGEDGLCDGPGTIEVAPHNTVHSWVGSDLNPFREDMGAFYSAARDPSFYPHRANIDRLWEVWRDIHGIYLPIKDPVWLNSYFYFYDENVQLVKIKVYDVINITNLRYDYEKIDLPWLSKRPKPSVVPNIAKSILKAREMNTNGSFLLHLPTDKPNAQTLDAPLTLKVYRPKPFKTKLEEEDEEDVLVVYGIQIKSNASVKFDVYVNLVDEATKVGPGIREFAGTFTRLPQHQGGAKSKSNMKFGISELLNDLEADGDEIIWVTIFPRTKSCANITIDGVRIEYMKQRCASPFLK